MYHSSFKTQGKTLYIVFLFTNYSLLISANYPRMNWHVAIAGVKSCMHKQRHNVGLRRILQILRSYGNL